MELGVAGDACCDLSGRKWWGRLVVRYGCSSECRIGCRRFSWCQGSWAGPGTVLRMLLHSGPRNDG